MVLTFRYLAFGEAAFDMGTFAAKYISLNARVNLERSTFPFPGYDTDVTVPLISTSRLVPGGGSCLPELQFREQLEVYAC